jgi:hypothetical protein
MSIDHDTFLQTGVSLELWGALKAHAALGHVSLYHLHQEVILLFLEHREALRNERHPAPYLTSPRGARPFNIRIPAGLAAQVQALSKKDNVPTRRILFTAVVHFAMSRNLTALLDPPTPPADREPPPSSAPALAAQNNRVPGSVGSARGSYHS